MKWKTVQLLFPVFLVLVFVSGVVYADIDAREFDNAEQRARYLQLINELRCPKCQNQNIADSDAVQAQDLRQIVYEKVMSGESDDVIKQFMQQRYGDFILYEPPVKPITYALWFGPLVLLLLVLLAIRHWLQKQRRHAMPLSDAERQQLHELLHKNNRNKDVQP